MTFAFEQVSHHIMIENVAVFPQCYAAVADRLPSFAKKTLVVDIGSWTIDIMPVIDRAPDESVRSGMAKNKNVEMMKRLMRD